MFNENVKTTTTTTKQSRGNTGVKCFLTKCCRILYALFEVGLSDSGIIEALLEPLEFEIKSAEI